MRVAVVGHVEWVEFLALDHVPAAGEIVHADSVLEVAAGGGAVAAVQLARLAGAATFFTAVGDDELGRRAVEELTSRGVEVRAAVRHEPQRRATTFVDATGERTITVVGERHEPAAADDLGWAELADFDGVYVTAGDGAAIRAARHARLVAATSRILPELQAAGVRLDALVGSATDPAERYSPRDLVPEPQLVVRTESEKGGTWQPPGSAPRRYAPGRGQGKGDAYGCGDSFAAGLTFSLAQGSRVDDALRFASDCGAAVAGGRGPYETQVAL